MEGLGLQYTILKIKFGIFSKAVQCGTACKCQYSYNNMRSVSIHQNKVEFAGFSVGDDAGNNPEGEIKKTNTTQALTALKVAFNDIGGRRF